MDPVLTPRLVLTPVGPDDVDDLILLFWRSEVAYWTGPWTREAVEVWAADMAARWKSDGVAKWMARDHDGSLVGRGGFTLFDLDGETVLELGWAVRDARTGNGYATEIGRAALAWAGTPAGPAGRGVHGGAQPCLAGSHGAARHAAGGHHPTCRTRRGPDGRAPRRRLRSVPTLSRSGQPWPGPADCQTTAGALGAASGRDSLVQVFGSIDRCCGNTSGASSGSQPMTRQTCGSPPQFGQGGTRSDMTAARRARSPDHHRAG